VREELSTIEIVTEPSVLSKYGQQKLTRAFMKSILEDGSGTAK